VLNRRGRGSRCQWGRMSNDHERPGRDGQGAGGAPCVEGRVRDRCARTREHLAAPAICVMVSMARSPDVVRFYRRVSCSPGGQEWCDPRRPIVIHVAAVQFFDLPGDPVGQLLRSRQDFESTTKPARTTDPPFGLRVATGVPRCSRAAGSLPRVPAPPRPSGAPDPGRSLRLLLARGADRPVGDGGRHPATHVPVAPVFCAYTRRTIRQIVGSLKCRTPCGRPVGSCHPGCLDGPGCGCGSCSWMAHAQRS